MCGGRGTRLAADVEKPLYPVCGVPMVDRVVAALLASDAEDIVAAVSPHAPATRDHLEGRVRLVETPGDGYVTDLDAALDEVGTPVVTAAADLPLLEGDAVDAVLRAAEGRTTVVVPGALVSALGASVEYDDTWVPAGLNVVADGPGARVESWDARLAVNVNRTRDGAAAERLVTDGS